LIGDSKSEFGGSLYMKELFDKVEGTLPEVDFEKELKLWNFIVESNKEGLLNCAKDVNVGGFVIALAKMSVISGKGVTVGVKLKDDRDIFSESFSRAIVEVDDSDAFESYAKKSGMKIDRIGKVGGDKFICCDIKRDVKSLEKVYFNRFQEVIEQDI
jgi:phosphoribosylformylglycinamidine synthase